MTTTEFMSVADGFRPELLAHCYRMIGSVHDAEDAVQETYLRAWRAYDRFEGRASLRTWLYRIATNTCLTALERNSRRPLPSGLGAPSDDPEYVAPPRSEVPWLSPVPDAMVAPDPAAVVVSRDSVRLAFVAALQHLPPRQRAVLILRDVLAWPAAEVSDLLGMTTAAVNSSMQRARAQLAEVMPAQDETAELTDPEQRELLARYVAALQEADVDSLTALLREDAELEMPPYPTWFAGRDLVALFYRTHVFAGDPGRWRWLTTSANGQPATASYRRGDDGVYRPHGLQVITATATGIARVVAFLDPSLHARFGLPAGD